MKKTIDIIRAAKAAAPILASASPEQKNLALEKIAVLEQLTVSDEEVEAEYTRISEAYNVPVDQVKGMVAVEDIKADMLVANAMKFVKDNAVVAND